MPLRRSVSGFRCSSISWVPRRAHPALPREEPRCTHITCVPTVTVTTLRAVLLALTSAVMVKRT